MKGVKSENQRASNRAVFCDSCVHQRREKKGERKDNREERDKIPYCPTIAEKIFWPRHSSALEQK